MNKPSSRKSKFFPQHKQVTSPDDLNQSPESGSNAEEISPEKLRTPEKKSGPTSAVHAQAVFNTLKRFNVSKIQTYSSLFQKSKGLAQGPENRERRESLKSPKLLKEYKYRKTITNVQDPKFKLENFIQQRPTFDFPNTPDTSKTPEPKDADQMSNSAGGDYKNFERTLSGYSYAMSSYFGEEGSDSPYIENQVTRRHKNQHILKKVLLAAYFLGILFSEQNRAKIFGAKHLKEGENVENKKPAKLAWLPLLPGHPFSLIWNVVLVIMMIASAVITPIWVSFINDGNTTFNTIDVIFDVVFGIDIIVNFITAYSDDHYGFITDLRVIAKTYVKKWFWIDLLAIIPFDTIITGLALDSTGQTSRVSKLLTLLKFSRLSRLFRILRLFKLAKLFSNNYSTKKLIRKLHLNVGIIKMAKVFGSVLIFNHIFGCIWFFWARMQDFGPDTWVTRNSLVDSDAFTQYLASIYWTFETLTTVGYGDITPGTSSERVLTVIWMLVGVAFYSFTIGNLSSILADMDRRSQVLKNKLTAFNNFASRVKLSDMIRLKIQNFFELNHKENVYYFIDPQEDVMHLPYHLKKNLLLYTYYPMIQNIGLLKVDANFTVAILLDLKLIKLQKKEILYREDDPAEEIFFVSKGSVNLVTDEGEGIFSFIEGTHFGEIEIFRKRNRLSFCQAAEPTRLLACDKRVFLKALQKFPDVQKHMDKGMKVRTEKLDARLADIRNKSYSLDVTQQDGTTRNNNKKLLKSSVYFLTMLKNKNKKARLFEDLPDFTPKSNMANTSAISFSSSKPTTPQNSLLQVLKSLKKKNDKEKEEEKKEETRHVRLPSESQRNLGPSKTSLDTIPDKPSTLTHLNVPTPNKVLSSDRHSSKPSLNLDFENETPKNQDVSLSLHPKKSNGIGYNTNRSKVASSIEDRTASFGNTVSEEDRFGRDSKRETPKARETQPSSTPKSSDTKVTTVSVTPKAVNTTQEEPIFYTTPSAKKTHLPLYMMIDQDKVIPEEPNSAFKVPEESAASSPVNRKNIKSPDYIKVVTQNLQTVYNLREQNKELVDNMKSKGVAFSNSITTMLDRQNELTALVNSLFGSKISQ